MSRVKILRASAGSGKTYRLAFEYIKAVIIDPRSYVSILAVTFTNKATEEMKSRILSELNALTVGKSPYLKSLTEQTGLTIETIVENAARARSLILHDYSHFAISTIDKFFQKIVRGFIKELGLDFGYTVELNSDSFIGEAVDRLIERTATESNLAQLISRVLDENVTNAKSWDIRPELSMIAREILKEQYQPLLREHEKLIEQFELIKTELRDQRDELEKVRHEVLLEMELYNLQPSDFSGASRSFAFYFVKPLEDMRIAQLIKVMDNADAWFSKTAKNKIVEALPRLMELTGEVVRLYEQYEIEKNSFDLIAENFNKSLLLSHIATELEKLWAERNRLPIHQTTKLIGTLIRNTAVPFIYEKAGNRFDRYMIDEFQDTSEGQWSNFVPLLDDVVARSSEERVMLIGDVKQAIYRWRGGDWDILARGAISHWGDAADDTEQLNTNWRSLPEVVEFNNRLLCQIVDQTDNNIIKQVYHNFEQDAPEEKSGGYVLTRCLGDDELESTVVSKVRDALSRGYSQRDIAMLVRGKKQGTVISEILLRAGFNIIDQESLLLSRSSVVNVIMATWKYALNRENRVCLALFNRLTNSELTSEFKDTELLDNILIQTPIQALDAVIRALSLEQTEVSYLQAFYQVVLTYCADNVPDLRAFIEWWDENSHKKSVYLPSSGDAITILTIHKSKGLQFPIVIIPQCSWQVEPIRRGKIYSTIWATTDEPRYSLFNPAPLVYKRQMEQSHYIYDYTRERVYSQIDSINLLYVAVTRAERELYIFYPPTSAVNNISTLIKASGYGDFETGNLDTYTAVKRKNENRQIEFPSFTINESTEKIRTSWDTERFYTDGSRIETPISYGVAMHALFSQIAVTEDIDRVIDSMVLSGNFTADGARDIRKRIDTALLNPTIASWFAPGWTIYNENAIMIPGSNALKRPDRVLVNGDTAVVIDYKFGSVRKNSYNIQIEQYKSLLTGMGYTHVSGYLWYVESGEVVTV